MILPKLIWNSLNLLIVQYNKKKIVYIFKFHNMTNDLLFSSCVYTMVLMHMMVLRSNDPGLQVSRSSDHSL